jgi:hypothetical protein
MKHVLKLLVAAMSGGTALAQSLDELPPDVAAVSKDAVAACRKIGGKPDYEPLDLVKLVRLDRSEAYLVDTRALRCKGGRNARKDGRVHCRDDHCKLIIMTPGTGDSFRITYRDFVEAWSSMTDGSINVTINGDHHTLRLGPDGIEGD